MGKYNPKPKKANPRYTPEYNEWRAKVLKRDSYRCQMPSCKTRRTKVQVHHIIKHSSSYYLRLVPENGVTLCRKCHDSIKDKEHHYVELFRMIVEKNEKK
jgi:5-methylcytosine-specific restriction endonuclease McrA